MKSGRQTSVRTLLLCLCNHRLFFQNALSERLGCGLLSLRRLKCLRIKPFSCPTGVRLSLFLVYMVSLTPSNAGNYVRATQLVVTVPGLSCFHSLALPPKRFLWLCSGSSMIVGSIPRAVCGQSDRNPLMLSLMLSLSLSDG